MPSRIALNPCGVTNFSPLATRPSTAIGMPFRSAICPASRAREKAILADGGREDCVLRPAEAELGVERGEARRRADVAPGAAVALAGEPSLPERGIEERLQRENARRASFEEPRVEHRDAGERELGRARRRAAAGLEAEVAARVVLGIVHEHEVRVRIGRRLQAPERKVGPHVAVDDEEWLVAQERQRGEQAAPRAERLGPLIAVADRDAARAAVPERLADAIAVPGQVDDDVAHAEVDERGEVILDQPVAADLEQRLRQLLRQRAHALAAAGREDHRFQRGGPARRWTAPNAGTTSRRSQASKSPSSAMAAVASSA